MSATSFDPTTYPNISPQDASQDSKSGRLTNVGTPCELPANENSDDPRRVVAVAGGLYPRCRLPLCHFTQGYRRKIHLAEENRPYALAFVDFAKVGYLNYCAQAGLGQSDLSKIEIIGPALREHIKPYKMARSFDQQLIWMKPVTNG